MLTPFILGALLAILLVPVNNAGVFQEGTKHPPSTLAFALFLGAAMSITAFPILARIMVETGLYRRRWAWRRSARRRLTTRSPGSCSRG